MRGDGHLSGMSVAGHLVRPTRGSNEAGRLLPFYLVLLRMGFTKLPSSPAALVSSYLTFSPLPSAIARGFGGVFSVALSLESLPLGVTQHPAPWSSDFPRTPVGAPAIVCPPRPRVCHSIIIPTRFECKSARSSPATSPPPARASGLARFALLYGSCPLPSSSSLANSSASTFSSRGTCKIATWSNSAIISRVRSKRGFSAGCLTL